MNNDFVASLPISARSETVILVARREIVVIVNRHLDVARRVKGDDGLRCAEVAPPMLKSCVKISLRMDLILGW